MDSLQSLQFRHPISFLSPKLPHHWSPKIYRRFRANFPGRLRICVSRNEVHSVCCFSKTGSEIEKVTVQKGDERPPFDINLAVILAGFAFEAYTTPPENTGRSEIDAADCKTVYLSEQFIREIYDGQLFIKLKKGFRLPAMVPWGISDPYVVIQMDSQTAKSKIKWGRNEPTWNQEFTFNIKLTPNKSLQVAAWDANLLIPHKRLGNADVNLECLCDGNSHEVLVELEGMGGGGKILLEVKYKSFDEIDEEKKWWNIPFVSELLRINDIDSALRKVIGSDTVQAHQFVQYAFGRLKTFNYPNIVKDKMPDTNDYDTEHSKKMNFSSSMLDMPSQETRNSDASIDQALSKQSSNDMENGHSTESLTQISNQEQSDMLFWRNLADIINQNIGQKLGLAVAEKLKWDGIDFLNQIGSQSRKMAELVYVESGLALPRGTDGIYDKKSAQSTIDAIQSSLPDVKKATENLMMQTDSILEALTLLTATDSKTNKEGPSGEQNEIKDGSINVADHDIQYSTTQKFSSSGNGPLLDEKNTEEMKALFSTAESAVEAWALLATSLGHPSFIKSEFEKICFLDNPITDTQVALWRDSARRRLVVAFRGTEQSRWKDFRTDLMVVPAGLNPERISGDFKQEAQVHSGFLSAYDSVRIRIMSLIRLAIGYIDDHSEPLHKWHVYVTGHSLGGSLATLLALQLSSSQLAKQGAISVTMYNFGSPRVGNRPFAEVYNEKVKDSWRVVNHRDIIPTVPRLMGYCHVGQPVYLSTGDLRNALENMEILGDGYQGDVIGESTPDIIVSEFMKGEMELIEKLLETEINIYRSIRDGSALMQHMEDFYYITLLESVKSNYQAVSRPQS